MKHVLKRLALPLVLLTTLAFGTWKLTESPAMWGDEGMIIELAVSLVRMGEMKIQLAPSVFLSPAFTSTGFPVVFPVAASLALFGMGILQARSVMVMFMLLCTGTAFLLGKKLHGTRDALLSALLIATFPPFYGDGKNVLGEVPGMFFLFAFLLTAHRVLTHEPRRRIFTLLAGLLLGLCLATKPIFLLLLPAVGLAACIHWKKLPRDLWLVPIAIIGFLLPVYIWIHTQFLPTDSARDILGFYSNPYHLENIRSVILTNILRFVHESTPLYLGGIFAVWMISVAHRLYTKRIGLIETIAFLFTGAILAAYLRTPGWYRYFFPAQLVTLLFIPASLRDLTSWIGKRVPRIDALPVSALALLILVQAYQVGFNSWVSKTYQSHMTRDLTAYFAAQDPSKRVFLHSAPELIPLLPNATYSQYIDLDPAPLGTEQLEQLRQGTPDILIMMDKRWDATHDAYPLYQERDRVGRYVISERR
jgi:4-amino-4-deoxy-L-arabinose transferase-like glycosyltransferase